MARVRGALDDLRLIHRILDRLRIHHALIGGWAAVAWGVVRATKDLDLLVLVGSAEKDLLRTSMERLGYHGGWRKGGLDDPVPELLRLSPKKAGGRPAIDFLPAAKAFEMDALRRAVPVRLGNSMIPVICREDLIAMKMAAGGGLDFQDARALLAIHAKTLDREILEASCRRLKVSRLLKMIDESGHSR